MQLSKQLGVQGISGTFSRGSTGESVHSRGSYNKSFTQAVGQKDRSKYGELEKRTYYFIGWVQSMGLWIHFFLCLGTLIFWCWGLSQVKTFDTWDDYIVRFLYGGTALARNAEYSRKHDPRWGMKVTFNYVLFAEHDFSNILTKERLEQTLEISRVLMAQEVYFLGKTWRWDTHLCSRATLGEELQREVDARRQNSSIGGDGPSEAQCVRMLPHDCFSEGGFDRPDFMDELHGPTEAGGLPSIRDFADEDLGLAFAHGCPNNLDGSYYRATYEYLGGAEYYGPEEGCNFTMLSGDKFIWETGTQCARHANLLELVYLMPSDVELTTLPWQTDEGQPLSLNLEDAKELYAIMMRKWVQVLRGETRFRAEITSSALITEAMETLADAPKKHFLTGLFLMVMLCVCSHLSFKPLGIGLAAQVAVGLLLVLMSTLAGLGISCLILGTIDNMVVQVAPFFALGVGIDDMLVYFHHFLHAEREGLTPNEYVGKAVASAFSSVTTTTVSNSALFTVAYFMIPVPLVQSTCIALLVCEAVNYVWLIMGLPLVLYWTARSYVQQDRAIVGALKRRETLKKLGVDEEGIWSSFQHAWALSNLTVKPARDGFVELKNKVFWLFELFQGTTCGRILLLGLLIVFLAGAVARILTSTLPVGMPSEDECPRYPTDDLYQGAVLWERYFELSYFYLQMKDIAYHDAQMQVDVRRLLTRLSELDLGVACVPWPLLVLWWASTFLPDNLESVCYNEDTGRIIDMAECGNSTNSSMEMDILKPGRYYDTYDAFISPVGKAANSSWSVTAATNPGLQIDRFPKDAAGHFLLTWTYCTMTRPDHELTYATYGGGQWRVDAVTRLHNFLESTLGGNAYAEGYLEFKLSSEARMMDQVPFIAIAGFLTILVVGSIATWSIVAGVVMVIIAAASAAEILALLTTLKLYFNFFCALCLLVVCGLSIDLTAHILVATRWAEGNPRERALEGVKTTFFPVVLGALSSIVGVVPMVFHYAGYVQKYFGLLNVVSIVICLFNAVIFLPVVYGALGPGAFALGDRIATGWSQWCPSCARRKDFRSQATRMMLETQNTVLSPGTVAMSRWASAGRKVSTWAARGQGSRGWKLPPGLIVIILALQVGHVVFAVWVLLTPEWRNGCAGATLEGNSRDLAGSILVHVGLVLLAVPCVLMYLQVAGTAERAATLHLSGLMSILLQIGNQNGTLYAYLGCNYDIDLRYSFLCAAGGSMFGGLYFPLLAEVSISKVQLMQKFPPGCNSPPSWGRAWQYSVGVWSILDSVLNLSLFIGASENSEISSTEFIQNMRSLKFHRVEESTFVRAMQLGRVLHSLASSFMICTGTGFLWHSLRAIHSAAKGLRRGGLHTRVASTAHNTLVVQAVGMCIAVLTQLTRWFVNGLMNTESMLSQTGDRWVEDEHVWVYDWGFHFIWFLDDAGTLLGCLMLSDIFGIFVRRFAPGLARRLGVSEDAGDVAERIARAARLARLDEAKAAVMERFGLDLTGLSFERVELALSKSVAAYGRAWCEHMSAEPLALVQLTNPKLGQREAGDLEETLWGEEDATENADVSGDEGSKEGPAGSQGDAAFKDAEAPPVRSSTYLSVEKDPIQPYSDIEQLLKDAEEVQSILKQKLAPRSEWACAVRRPHDRGADVLDGPEGGWAQGLLPFLDAAADPGVKRRERIQEKAMYKYRDKGGVARVRDIARLALYFDTAERLMSAVPSLYRSFLVVDLENRFNQPTPLGWADITVLVMIQHPSLRSYHIAELQLQLRGFVNARAEAHVYYGELRQMLPSAGVPAEQLSPVLDCILSIIEDNEKDTAKEAKAEAESESESQVEGAVDTTSDAGSVNESERVGSKRQDHGDSDSVIEVEATTGRILKMSL